MSTVSAEKRKQIASIVYTDCTLVPGSNFYTAAEFAINAMDVLMTDLFEALKALTAECEAAGHGTDRDYNWAKCMQAAHEALQKVGGA